MATNKTKVIHVTGEDYAAVFFEDWVKSNKLSFEEACQLTEIEDGEGYAEITVYEFGAVDSKFINFIYNIQDYESSKHENFFIKGKGIFKE